MPVEERRHYNNLLLLCADHGRDVDDRQTGAAAFPVKAAALAPPRPVPLAAGSGIGTPARRSGLFRPDDLRHLRGHGVPTGAGAGNPPMPDSANIRR